MTGSGSGSPGSSASGGGGSGGSSGLGGSSGIMIVSGSSSGSISSDSSSAFARSCGSGVDCAPPNNPGAPAGLVCCITSIQPTTACLPSPCPNATPIGPVQLLWHIRRVRSRRGLRPPDDRRKVHDRQVRSARRRGCPAVRLADMHGRVLRYLGHVPERILRPVLRQWRHRVRGLHGGGRHLPEQSVLHELGFVYAGRLNRRIPECYRERFIVTVSIRTPWRDLADGRIVRHRTMRMTSTSKTRAMGRAAAGSPGGRATFASGRPAASTGAAGALGSGWPGGSGPGRARRSGRRSR